MQPSTNTATEDAVPQSSGGVTAKTTPTNVRIVKIMFSVGEDTVEDDINVEDTFANAIWPSWFTVTACVVRLAFYSVCPHLVLAIAQCFGLMPVEGIRPTPHTPMVFRWRTLRVLWTCFYMAAGVAYAFLYLRQISRSGIDARNVGEWNRLWNNLLTKVMNYKCLFFQLASSSSHSVRSAACSFCSSRSAGRN